MAKISGVGVAALAGGSILTYSAVRGKSVSSVFRALLAGQSPSTALGANAINPLTGGNPGTSATQLNTVPGGPGMRLPVQVSTPGPGERNWIVALLTAINAPATDANIKSLSSWIAHEGPFGTQGENNPLNTSYTGAPGYAGKWSLAPIVSMYSTVSGGLIATVKTLESYPNILAALRSGQGLCGNPNTAAEFSRWSGGGYSYVC